jgi:hypothetical protein
MVKTIDSDQEVLNLAYYFFLLLVLVTIFFGLKVAGQKV